MRKISGKKLKCVITGNVLYHSKDYYEKKLAKFPDEETLERVYICREARSFLKRGYGIEEVRAALEVKEDIGEIDSDHLKDILFHNNINISLRSKMNTLTSVSSFTYNETDPEVKKFIEKL